VLTELTARLREVDPAGFDRHDCEQWLAGLTRLHAAAEAARLRVVNRLAHLAEANPAIFPEQTIADASRTSLREGLQVTNRAAAVASMPPVADALAAGGLTAGHVDVLARQVAQLQPEVQVQLAARAERIALRGASATVEQFARYLQREVRSLLADDGAARFMQQRRATHVRTWISKDSGMVCLHGEFDPESGSRLLQRIDRQVQALFSEATPDTCPSDPIAKNNHLKALALVALSSGAPAPTGPPQAEISVLIDFATLCEGLSDTSILEVGTGVEVPVETVRRWACAGALLPIVLDGAGVVLDVGRAKRLATADQRRALRAMYPTCAIPDCPVPATHCEPHHITWWRHGGGTDMANLVPLCNRHHHAVHEGGWQIELRMPDRQLTVRLADGAIRCTGPPRRRAG
jgi:hypothetical protein